MSPRHRDIVAVGASAGGVEALRALVAGLPPGYPGTLLVVLHVPPNAPSALPAILSRSGPLPATTAVHGEELRPGHILVAPNDRHLLILDGRVRLSHGPAENGHRPAVDPLFRSVARAAGDRAVGIVLSGTRDDGAAGLAGIAAHGGMTLVQDPGEALHPWMPRAAIALARPRHVVAAATMGGLLAEITAADLVPGDPLLPAQRDPALESALWTAVRALEDQSALSRRMARTTSVTTHHFLEAARSADEAATVIRRLIHRLDSTTEPF